MLMIMYNSALTLNETSVGSILVTINMIIYFHLIGQYFLNSLSNLTNFSILLKLVNILLIKGPLPVHQSSVIGLT